MRTIYIERYDNDERGCYGSLSVGNFDCYTLELPWRDNQPNVSCIPVGTYEAFVDHNVTIGRQEVIRLKDVPNRTGVLIHVGNYTSDIAGCVLVGNSQVTNSVKKMVTSSRNTMENLLAEIGDDGDTELVVEVIEV